MLNNHILTAPPRWIINMETVLHALFKSEADAFKGQQLLEELNHSADIDLGETYLISKDDNGQARIRSAKGEDLGRRTVAGGLVGGLLGLLGGPIGFLVGSSAGLVIGTAGDAIRADDTEEYLQTVTERLPNGQTVLIAHLWEDWTTPVNSALLPLTADLYRLDVAAETDRIAEKQLADLNRAIADAETKAQQGVDQVKADWQARLAELKQQRDALVAKIRASVEQQTRQYERWLDQQRKHYENWREGLEADLRDEKRKHLQERIAHQQARLKQLEEEYETV